MVTDIANLNQNPIYSAYIKLPIYSAYIKLDVVWSKDKVHQD
jgi:hypothetical protein